MLISPETTIHEVTSIYATALNVSDFTFASSTYIEGINAEFNTSLPDINLALLSTMNVVKQTGARENEVWVKVLVDGSIILEEELLSLNQTGSRIDEMTTCTRPISFNIASSGAHNITYEFKRTGNGAVEVNDIDISLIKFSTVDGYKIRDQITAVDYTHSSNLFADVFNWSVNTPVESGTFIIGKFTLESIAESTLQYYYKNPGSGTDSFTWRQYLSDSSDTDFVSGFFADLDKENNVNYSIFSKSSLISTNVTGHILDFDLANANATGVNGFTVSNESTNIDSKIFLSEGTHLLASENVAIYNGTGYFLAMTASFRSASGAQSPVFFINCTQVPEFVSKKEKYLSAYSDIGGAYIYDVIDGLKMNESYDFNLWVTVESGEYLMLFDEALAGFETTGFDITSFNTAPRVAIVGPEPDDMLSGVFSVNASVSDNDGDTFVSSVNLSNSTGPVKTYPDLSQNELYVTFNSSLYADGPYNITWKACENASGELYCVEDMIAIAIDNNEPSIDFNDVTTDTGNYSQNWILGNITVIDAYLNASGIYLYNSTVLVNSSISGNTIHTVNFTDLNDGYYYLNASAWDLAGNTNETENRSILLDTQEADIEFNPDSTVAGNVSQSHIFANVTATDRFGYDNLSIWLYNVTALINSSYVEGSGLLQHNFTPLPDGVYYLNSTVIDLVGNVNATPTRKITLDTVNPGIDFNSETTDAGNYVLDWILANITVSDTNLNASGIYLYNSTSLVNSSISGSTTHYVNFTSLPDDRYYLNATVWDLAGNTNETENRTILLDTQAPIVNFSADTTKAGGIKQDWIFANVTVIDAFGYSNVTLYLYNSTSLLSSHSGNASYTFTNLSDGMYYLNSTVVDLSGNTNVSGTLQYLVDTAVPMIEFNDETTDEGNYSLDWIVGNITVSDVNLDASGIYLYNTSTMINSSISGNTTHDMNFTDLEDGRYSIYASVWDLAGNSNRTRTREILIDNVAPDIDYNQDSTAATNLDQTWIFANMTASDRFGYYNLTIDLYNVSGLLNSSTARGTDNYSYNFTGLADGVYHLNATVVDLAGNTNTSITREIILDTVDPVVVFNDGSSDAGNYSRNWILGNVTASDLYLNVSTIQLFNSGGPVNSSTSNVSTHAVNFTGLIDDYYILNATVMDLSGNSNETENRIILLDTQRPIVDFSADTTDDGDLSLNWIFANVTVTDTFGYSNVTFSLYNSSSLVSRHSGSDSYNFTNLSDGAYHLNSTVVDLAGNSNVSETLHFLVDTAKPLIDFNGDTTQADNYSLDWILGNVTVSDANLNASGIYLYNSTALVNSSISNLTTHYVNFTYLDDSWYYLNASVWDLAGNENSTETRTILLDTQESDIEFSSDTTAASNLSQTYIFANVTCEDVFGYDNLTIWLYNSAGLLNSSSAEGTGDHIFNFTGLSDGVYYLNSTVVDLAGNVNETSTRTITLDTTTPLIDFNDETTATGNFSQNWTLGNITVSDTYLNASSIRLFNSSGPVNSSMSSSTNHVMNFTGLADGYYQLNASVWDLAGNENSTETRTILLDTQESDIAFSSDTTAASNLSQTYIFANVTCEDVFGYDNLTIWLYNSAGLLNSSSYEGTGDHIFNFTGLSDGVYYLNSTIIDLAGNENETATRTIILDTTTPLIDFNDETTATGNFSQNWTLGNITVSDTYLNASSIRLFNSSGPVNSSMSSSTNHVMNFTGLADGYYQLNASVWDLAGNENSTETRTILLDTQESDIEFSSDTTAASNLSQTYIFANVTCEDVFGYDNLTIWLYNSAGLLNSSSAEGTGDHIFNFTGLADGVYYLNSTIIDLAGNVNETATRTIILDTTTPLIDFNDETTATGNFSQNWTLGNITVSDAYLNASSIRLFNSSGPVNSSMSSSTDHVMNFTGLADGYYQLNASVWDLAGNENSTETRTILLDTQESDIAFSSDTTAASNLSQTYIFANVTCEDVFGYDNLTIWLYNSAGLLNSSSAEGTDDHIFNFTGLADGVYYLNSTIIDLAGNENETATRIIILDTTTPLIDFNDETTATGNFSQNWTLGNITVSDTYLNASSIRLFNSNGPVNSSMSSSTDHVMNFTGLADGYYQLNASVWDLAGNENSTETRTILLDTQESDIAFSSDTTAASNLSQTYIFANVTCEDVFGYDNLTIWLYNSAGLLNSSSAEGTGDHIFNFTGLADGVYYLNSTIIDLAGNENETATRTIILDTTTPLIDFNDETTATGNFSQNWTLGNITVSDTYLNASSIRLFNSSGPVNSSMSSSTDHVMNFTGLADGYYQLNASVWDLAGNENSTETRTILLDTQESDIEFSSDTTAASNLSQTYIFANVTCEDVFGYDNLTIWLYNSAGLLNSSSDEGTGDHIFNFTGLSDGVYYLNSTIIDLAGNVNETATRTIILDTTTPLIDFNDETTVTGNFSQSWILGNITVSDTYLNASSIRLFNSSGPVNSSMSSSTDHVMNFTGLSDGYYQLNASVWDFAGNENETQTNNILLDTGVPLVSFNTSMPAEANYSRDWLLTSINISDTFGIANITFDLYNRSVFGNNTSLYNTSVISNPPSGQAHVNFTSLPSGMYTVNVTIVDFAGNANNTTSLTYGIDAVDMKLDNVRAQTQDISALIVWNTNEVTNSTVYYGLDENVTLNVSKADFELNHSIRLTGLDDDTLYYYKVVCCDPFGFNNSTQVLNFTTEKTYVDDGRPYYYPEEPEEEPEGEDQKTGPVKPRTVIVNAGDGEEGDTLDVDLTEDDSAGESMVTGISIELGMDVGELDVTCSQSPDSSQDYPMDISLAVGSGANIYGYVNLDTSSPGSVDGATIQFRIPAAWYEDNGLDPSSTAITHFADGSPQIDVLEVTDSSSDGEYYYFTVTTPGFSEFALAAFPVEEDVEEEMVEILDEGLTDEPMPEPEDEGSSGFLWMVPVVAVILGLVVFVIWKKQDK